MKILIDRKNLITKNSICGIGSFDGVHRGHQGIVEYLKKSVGHKKRIGIITFIPLPFFVLKSAPIIYLTLKKEKENVFKELGVDFIYYFKFTKEFSQLTPSDFVKLVVTKISPSTVVIGENFHFGKGRKGSAKLLMQLALNNFSVHILPRVKEDGTISSTRIRELLLLGRIEAANKLLGRQYTISGKVIKGKGKGKKLGFPTINIRVQKEKLIPLDGVYRVKVPMHNKEFLGAMFCHHNLLEIHLLNFSGNLYKKEVSIKLFKRIRNVRKFSTAEALQRAIARDIEVIRKGYQDIRITGHQVK
ncbi:MAG: riboflavin biosynthesis protein RibF [Candidatus Stahlbacteria bacterium]|nr:MAG: riboflavin biosynthesis protein RibF [Candidatus Stahlbacteria bacterium]